MSRWTQIRFRNPALAALARAVRASLDPAGPLGDRFFPSSGCPGRFRLHDAVDGPLSAHPWVSVATDEAGRPCLAGPLTVGVLATLWRDAPGLAHRCDCGGDILVIGLTDQEVRSICEICGTLARRSLSASRFEMHVRQPLRRAGREPLPDPSGIRLRRPWLVEGWQEGLDWQDLLQGLAASGIRDLPNRGPEPIRRWPTEATRPVVARWMRACLRHRLALLARDPWVPFPQGATCYAFGPDRRPLPLGALFRLWDAGVLGRDCPCGANMLPFAFGGFLSLGGAWVTCPDCERSAFRAVGGLVRTGRAASEALEGSGFEISASSFGGALPAGSGALRVALAGLGETDLPPDEGAGGPDPDPRPFLRLGRR